MKLGNDTTVNSKEHIKILSKTRSLPPSGCKSPLLSDKNYDYSNRSPDSKDVISLPKLSDLASSYDAKEQKMSGNRLLVCPNSPLNLRSASSELWRPNTVSQKSNWDIFFESQTEHTMLKTPELSKEEIADWDLEDSQLPSPQLSQDNPTSVVTCSKEKKVFVSYVTKDGMKWTKMNILLRMEEIAIWLNKDSDSEALPIGEYMSPRKDIQRGRKFRKQTISETVGDCFDPLKQGLVFFVGPVDGKLCFKMSVCDLEKIKAATAELANGDEEKT